PRPIEGFQMFARNDQDVGRRLRVDVAKGDAVLVLEDQLRRYLAAYDSTEQTIVSHRSGVSSQLDGADHGDRGDARRLESKRGVGKSGRSPAGAIEQRALVIVDPALGAEQQHRFTSAGLPRDGKQRIASSVQPNALAIRYVGRCELVDRHSWKN